nr:tRNA pseudouridine(55) synthase TruB [Zoogloeaceae bacterium]
MQKRIARRQVDGVLLLDKPRGLSSNHALQKAKRLFNAAKAGHTGTLDPMATGLLPLTFGEATKFSQMLLDADKSYEATVTLGVVTDTGDAEGQVLERQSVTADVQDVAAALNAFRGEIEQIPPMYSALKRDGRPLYEYARAGIELERAPRRVVIHALEMLDGGLDGSSFGFRVRCSKGTYVRTLAMDIGRALGCGAHLSALRRTAIGPFGLDDAVSIERIESCSMDGRDALLASCDTLVGHLVPLQLDESQACALLQGRSMTLGECAGSGLVRLYAGARFIGLGEINEGGKLSPKRLIATGPAV